LSPPFNLWQQKYREWTDKNLLNRIVPNRVYGKPNKMNITIEAKKTLAYAKSEPDRFVY